jgi:homocysteine S-methyltransferase
MPPSPSPMIEVLAGDISEELFRRGVPNDRNMLSASALATPSYHEVVVSAYDAYIKAGATLLATGNLHVVPGVGFTTDEVRELTKLAGSLARETRNMASEKERVKICGLLPPLMPSFRSDRTVAHQEGVDMYALIAEALYEYVDSFLATSMSSLKEAKLAYEAVEHLQKPVLVSFALSCDGQLRSGEDVAEAIRKLVEFCDERGKSGGNSSLLSGVLFNCSQPEDITKALKDLSEDKSGTTDQLRKRGIRLGGFGDCISPRSRAGEMETKLVSGEMRPVMDKELFANFALRWVEFGAKIVGSCCAVPPEYLERVAECVRATQG